MKPVFHTPNPAEAALICGFLQENGIEAVVANRGLIFGFGELPMRLDGRLVAPSPARLRS